MEIDNKVRLKLKQVKYQHLKKLLDKNLSKYPQNCKYNKEVVLPNRQRLNICSFNLEDNKELDLCYKNEHSRFCNAFCPIKTKESLKEEFDQELKIPQIRATKYKDVQMLFWLYPELELEEISFKYTLKDKIYCLFKSFFDLFF